ncbi:MAG: peptide chain release factor N(5)-glutamine methyltransferase [Candidatus Aminicenantes bacterium]|nr:peptide chain release factor N(5)-glutamine methyltransferase [Candidatus Aminicenantes bacterium]
MRSKTLNQLFRQAARKLSCSACPFLEARLLIQMAGRMTESDFFQNLDSPVPKGLENRLNRLVKKRKAGWPMAYLLGKKEFWSLEFKVNRWVFIPRPETELVVEKVLSLPLPEKPRILDVGTGSGNIAIALAKELPSARVIASDLSKRALKIARENARKNQVKNVEFVQSNLLYFFLKSNLLFDLIVSNPPYVAEKEWKKLDRPVRDFEPKRALVAGPSGLEIIEKLIKQAWFCLKPGGYLVMEIGATQEKTVLELFSSGWGQMEILPDYSGLPRVFSARKD